MNFLCKTQLILKLYHGAVVKDTFAGDIAENLVRNHAHDFEVERLVTVDERMEGAVETSVVGDEFPVFHIARFTLFIAGDDKLGAADFVGLAVVEEHIFACGGGRCSSRT